MILVSVNRSMSSMAIEYGLLARGAAGDPDAYRGIATIAVDQLGDDGALRIWKASGSRKKLVTPISRSLESASTFVRILAEKVQIIPSASICQSPMRRWMTAHQHVLAITAKVVSRAMRNRTKIRFNSSGEITATCASSGSLLK